MNKKPVRLPHREALPPDLARPLLSSAWQRLETARQELVAAVRLANQELSDNPLAGIVADHVMRQIGKRGSPRITVDPDGSVMLEVQYEALPKDEPPAVSPPPPPAPRTEDEKRKSTLPSIVSLRHEAEALGIDPTPFGKNKTRLIQAIGKAQSAAPPKPTPKPPAPVVALIPDPVVPPYSEKKAQALADLEEQGPARPKMIKTAPALTPVAVVSPAEDDDDLSTLFDGLDSAPAPAPSPVATPRRGTPAPTGPAKKVGGRSLSDLVSKATDEVDIDAILSKGQPTTPPPEE